MAKASSIVIAGKARPDGRYVNVAGDTMTGTLTLNGDTFATQGWVTNSIINGAPGTLDTLNELAAALGDDANFAATVTNALAGKASTSHNHDSTYLKLSGNQTMNGVLSLNSTIDAQLMLRSADSWTGIGFDDSSANGADYIWHWGATGTFAIGGGGSAVANKRLHIHGAVTIGESLSGTSAPSQGLNVEGNVQAYGLQGNGNVGGTGAASWHPSGIYSAGYNWLYGGGSFNTGDWSSMGNLRTHDSSDGFWARYNAGNDNYAATLFWNTLQLGNNGQNVIYVGKTNAGGYLDFYTNVTGDRSTSGAVLAMRLHADGRVSINSGTDSGYGLTVGGGLYVSGDWVRVEGNQGIYFQSYGGGWRMSDSTWIRAWNDKSIYTGGTVQAARFEDANDSAYYLDPSASTSLNIAGKIVTAASSGTMMSNGSMSDAIGWNGSYGTYIGSTVGGTSYLYANGTLYTGGVFRTLIHSGNIGSQSVNYATSAGNADTVDNYHVSSLWKLNEWNGNIYGHTDGRIYGTIFYDANDSNYYVNPNDTSNLNFLNLGNTREEFPLLRMGAGGRYAIGVSGAHTRISSHNQGSGVQLGSYDGTTFTPKLIVSNDGNVSAESSLRAPIFYDSQDTSYYVDPNGSSRLGHLYVGNVAGSNDGSWNARMKVIGSSHARLDVVSNSDGIITTMFAHTGHGAGKVGTYSNHPLKLVINGNDKATLDSSGNFTVVGRFTETSSQKYKTNIQDLGPTLEKVDQLRGVTYSKIGSEETEIGMIAEEVAQIFPDLISYNEEGQIESLNYTRITAVLVEAVKELNAKVKTQEIFIDNIVARLERLENK